MIPDLPGLLLFILAVASRPAPAATPEILAVFSGPDALYTVEQLSEGNPVLAQWSPSEPDTFTKVRTLALPQVEDRRVLAVAGSTFMGKGVILSLAFGDPEGKSIDYRWAILRDLSRPEWELSKILFSAPATEGWGTTAVENPGGDTVTLTFARPSPRAPEDTSVRIYYDVCPLPEIPAGRIIDLSPR